MKPVKITTLLLAVLLLQLSAFAQNPKQELNDQLWEAARSGDAAAVTALLDKGADVNARFRYGTTALFKAAERGNIEVVKVLLARGADVAVKDTFYGATAMTWALDQKHDDVVRALLEKSPESVDEVLLTGAREKKVGLVQIALARGGATPEALTTALVAATTDDAGNVEIVDLLKKAGAVPPPQIDAATLQSYVGKYKAENGREISVSLKDDKLTVTFMGQQPLTLMAVNQMTFKPTAFGGLSVTFKLENNKVTSLEVKQGPTATLFKRVEETKQQ
jgi:ankyrin repeat protein